MRYFVPQINENDCALSATKMFCGLLTKNRDYLNVELEGKAPYSLKTIEKSLDKYGITLKFYETTQEIGYPDNIKQKFLAVLQIKSVGEHMVVVTKITKRFVTFIDPASGKRKMKKYEFNKLFSGVYGVGVKEDYGILPLKKEAFALSSKIPSYVFLILEELCLIAGFYGPLNEEDAYLRIIAFGLVFVFEVTRRICLLLVNKGLSNKYRVRLYDDDHETFCRNVKEFNEYKKYYLTLDIELFSRISTALLISLFLGMNSPSFFICVAILSIAYVFRIIMFSSYVTKMKGELSWRENKLFEKYRTKRNAIAELKRIENTAGNLGFMYLLTDSMFKILAFVLTLIPVFIENEPSMNFFLFHWIGLLAIEECLNPLLNYAENYRKKQKAKEYFQQYINN